MGNKTVSRFGKKCLHWKVMAENFKIPHRFPDKTVEDAKNFCRNPTNKTFGPWCFVDINNWEYCDVERCSSMIYCHIISLNTDSINFSF